MSQRQQTPVTITTARTGRSQDIHRREVRYLISMGIRTVCFVLAVVIHNPVRWGLVAAAFVLPYVAVVIANASNRGGGATVPIDDGKRQLTAGHSESELPPPAPDSFH